MPEQNDAVIEQQLTHLGRELKAPRTAAFAGIAFAVLYGSCIIILTLSVPQFSTTGSADTSWLQTHESTLKLALFMIPYAGIAFLWFIGVLRDQLGHAEDRFLSTVFFGSGILFLALTFLAAALMGGLLASYDVLSSTLEQGGVFLYGRSVIYEVFQLYSIRMAAVFMSSLGTIWYRTRVMNRAWAILTYGLSVVLLLSIGFSLWILLIFPGWVFVVSVRLLVQNFRTEPGGAAGTAS